MDSKRTAVYFAPNTSECVALETTVPFESHGKWGYWLTDHRIMFVPKVCSVLIGTLDPQPGEEFYITRQVTPRNGRGTNTEWLVSGEPSIPTHQPGPNGKPTDIAAAVDATGIPESQLERQLRESKEVRDRAANNIRARLNLEKREPPVPTTAPATPALTQTTQSDFTPEPPRKPPVMEAASVPPPPPPVAPEPPKAPERYIWFPNLIEVARSYTYKLNTGNYESRDFFCSQKAECRPEDADLVSERLYEFCKRQVMKAVAQETGRKSA